MLTENDIEILFSYHEGSNIPIGRFSNIRNAAKYLGKMILDNGGKESDKEEAIKKLRECVCYAISSIVIPELENEKCSS